MNEGFFIDYLEVNCVVFDYFWVIIFDLFNGDVYCGCVYCYDWVNDFNVVFVDFICVKNVGYLSGSEGIGMIWRKKVFVSIDVYFKNGGNFFIVFFGIMLFLQFFVSCYCMCCFVIGFIYVFEDDIDVYNYCVCVEKKKFCFECGGCGVC